MLRVENISKKFDNFELKNISFHLEEGFIMGLIGPNGSGKTTLIKLIMNLLEADEGKIYFKGKEISQNLREFKENIGFVYDNLYFYENLKVKDFKRIISSFYSKFDSDKFDEYLLKFKIDKNTKIRNLSKGQNIKLMLANALSHNAKLLILDEPTSGLDPVARNEILDIFQDFIQDENKGIFVSSHITSDLEHIADYITFINDGEIIFTKTRDELLENYGIVKCTEEDFKKIDKKDYIKYKKNRYEYDVLIENKYEFKKKYDISVIDKTSLEDIMLIYIKGEK